MSSLFDTGKSDMTVSERRRPTVPNYDLPNAAPEPLRRVQLFVNSIDREHDREWLPAWLEEHGLPAAAFARAVALREALHPLLRVTKERGTAPEARAHVYDAASVVRVELG